MIAVPAIDLREGRVVQLVGGRPDQVRVSLPDPAAVARRWIDDGFTRLHLVDLDAALGTGTNRDAIRAVLSAIDVPVQVGGGVRSAATAAALLADGASCVVVGTRAVTDRPWLERLARAHPGRVVVAADARDRTVVTHGWTDTSGTPVADFVTSLHDLPLAAVLVTDVGREGAMGGADVDLFETLVGTTAHPLIASGGIAGSADLAALAAAGVHAAVLGMALYTGALDGPTTARSYRA